MKTKIIRLISAVFIIAVCSACAEGPAPTSGVPNVTEERQEKYSMDEYLLYQNVFHGDYGKKYDGARVEKEGVFAVLYDAFAKVRRYYVWGYYDQTKCCDWQWEFVPEEGATLPPVGSLVTVTGTFVSDKDALDGYRIVEAHTEPITVYSGPSADTDMRAMSCTLERVQMLNIIYRPDDFQDVGFSAYGRIASEDSLKDPYYDGSWEIGFSRDGSVPGIGTLVEITGTVRDGKLTVDSMEIM